MKLSTRLAQVTVEIIEGVAFDKRELAFLRDMARHCIATDMPGSAACVLLVKLIDRIGIVDDRRGGPVYGIFETEILGGSSDYYAAQVYL